MRVVTDAIIDRLTEQRDSLRDQVSAIQEQLSRATLAADEGDTALLLDILDAMRSVVGMPTVE